MKIAIIGIQFSTTNSSAETKMDDAAWKNSAIFVNPIKSLQLNMDLIVGESCSVLKSLRQGLHAEF